MLFFTFSIIQNFFYEGGENLRPCTQLFTAAAFIFFTRTMFAAVTIFFFFAAFITAAFSIFSTLAVVAALAIFTFAIRVCTISHIISP